MCHTYSKEHLASLDYYLFVLKKLHYIICNNQIHVFLLYFLKIFLITVTNILLSIYSLIY